MTFILVTMNPNIRFLLPIDQIAAIREPLPNDELLEGTKTIVVSKLGISLFVIEDMEYFLDKLGDKILRKFDA